MAVGLDAFRAKRHLVQVVRRLAKPSAIACSALALAPTSTPAPPIPPATTDDHCVVVLNFLSRFFCTWRTLIARTAEKIRQQGILSTPTRPTSAATATDIEAAEQIGQ